MSLKYAILDFSVLPSISLFLSQIKERCSIDCILMVSLHVRFDTAFFPLRFAVFKLALAAKNAPGSGFALACIF